MRKYKTKVSSGRYKGRGIVLHTYDGLGDVYDHFHANEDSMRSSYMWRGKGWAGDLSADQCMGVLKKRGDAKFAQGSQDTLDGIELPSFESYVVRPSLMLSGGAPAVPAYLAGYPASMHNMEPQQTDRSEVRIFCCTIGSASISAKDLEKRGLVCLSLARILLNFRPVTLYAYSALDAKIKSRHGAAVYCWKLPTQPLDLAQCGFTFGCQGMTRILTFCHAQQNYGYTGQWPFDAGSCGPEATRRCILDSFPGIDEERDLVLPGLHSEDDLIREPKKWLARQLQRYLTD